MGERGPARTSSTDNHEKAIPGFHSGREAMNAGLSKSIPRKRKEPLAKYVDPAAEASSGPGVNVAAGNSHPINAFVARATPCVTLARKSKSSVSGVSLGRW